MYDNYDLFAAVDEYITRPKFNAPRERRFYPSEASVEVYDKDGDKEVIGGCLRSAYFRLHGNQSLPEEARSEFIFKQGHQVEQMLIAMWKEMGIWYADHVKFVDHARNISGEMDAILIEPSGTRYIVEVKSFYGYMAKSELFGDKHSEGMPKMSQLLQTLIYLDQFKDRIPYARMVYFARDDDARRTFKIEFAEMEGKLYPKVEGRILTSFCMDDIYARYALLQRYIEQGQIPPADFELQYSPDKIERLHAKGKMGKTKYEKFIGNKLKPDQYIGNWQCRYCKFKNQCWGVTRAYSA